MLKYSGKWNVSASEAFDSLSISSQTPADTKNNSSSNSKAVTKTALHSVKYAFGSLYKFYLYIQILPQVMYICAQLEK